MLEIKENARQGLGRKAQRAYLENQVRGASTMELQQLLYEGLIRNILTGKSHLESENWEAAHEDLSRAKRIVNYMLNSLRPEGGEISKQLRRLYAFSLDRISRAILEHKTEHLDGVLPVVQELAGAWAELSQKVGPAHGGGDAA